MNPDVTRLLNILAQTASEAPPSQFAQAPQPQLPPHASPASDPRLPHGGKPSQYPPEPVPAQPVDPKGITDWPAALKYVMNTVYRDEVFIAQIKKMKKHQHDHERMWWASREEIVKKHEARVEGNKKVTDLLKKLGTIPTAQLSKNLPTPESEKEELRIFDQKVHLRSEEMVKHMTAEFAHMGIPFFCRTSLPGREDSELQSLRKRIVELLEDLCEGE